MAEISFRIDKKGNVHIDVAGVADASCEDITRAFVDGLGVEEEVQRKPLEYHELDGLQVFETDGE